MTLVSPSRVAIFNTTRDALDTSKVHDAPDELVKQALREMEKYRKMARERHREIESDLAFGAVGMRLPKLMRGG
jgi:hypothetical protein